MRMLVFLAVFQLTPYVGGVAIDDSGTLPFQWTTGGGCPGTPPFKTHYYNDTFVILRQSGCTNFEKPFLYLLFGTQTALLVDTGAKGGNPVEPVRQAMTVWSIRH